MKWFSGTALVMALTTAALSLLAGCGGSGSSEVTLPPGGTIVQSKITGVVSAPDGVYAMAPRWWERPFNFSFAAPAMALIGESHVGAGLPVSLARLDSVDFADGSIDDPLPLVIRSNTDEDGRFTIIGAVADEVAGCDQRKMLAVGGGDELSRAIVFAHSDMNIDAVSEALVRVLLYHVAHSQHQLCDYSIGELANLYATVDEATQFARGTTVFDINADAFRLAQASPAVQSALAAFGDTAEEE